MMNCRTLARALALTLFAGSTILAQSAASQAPAAAPSAAPGHSAPAVQTLTLPNGLKVILSQDRRLPVVAVNIWYHVGPANELPGRTGFAHLFEHMMFQGSKHVARGEHFKLLEARGGSDINGTTDFDRTNYFETVPSSELELALWLESDRMGYLLENWTGRASKSEGRGSKRAATSVENPPYGIVDEADVPHALPAGPPVLCRRDRIARRHPGREAGRCAQFLPAVLRAEQRQPGDRRRLRQGQAKALVEKYFGTLKQGRRFRRSRPRRRPSQPNGA